MSGVPDRPTDLAAILQAQPDARVYVANAGAARVTSLDVGGRRVPLVVNGAPGAGCYLVSPTAQYLDYAMDEAASLGSRTTRWALQAAAAPVRALLRVRPLDRVVYAGHWLLPTNPPQGFDRATVEALVAHVQREYPGHALVVRNLDAHAQQTAMDTLEAQGFALQLSREVHWFLPDRELPRKVRHNIRSDVVLLERAGYTVRDGRDLTPGDVDAMRRHYRALYLGKHSPHNADYTAAWFDAALAYPPMRVRTLYDGGRLLGFVLSLRSGGRVYPQIVGYDPDVPREASPYRALVATLIRDAQAEGTPLFLSSGVSQFKKNRGTAPVYEFDAVYARNTPAAARLTWRLLHRAYRAFADEVYAENAI